MGRSNTTFWRFGGSQSTMNAAPESGKSKYVIGCHKRTTTSENEDAAPIRMASPIPNQASMIHPNTTSSGSAGTGIQPMKMNMDDNTTNDADAPAISRAARVTSTSMTRTLR